MSTHKSGYEIRSEVLKVAADICKEKFKNDPDFLTEENKNKISTLFFDVMKNYYIIKKFARRVHFFNLKKADITTDLCLNELDSFTDKQKITLIDRNVIYEFKITDLLNIIKTALTNYTDVGLIEPLTPKNPYTNLEFTKANLYNIFYRVKLYPIV